MPPMMMMMQGTFISPNGGNGGNGYTAQPPGEPSSAHSSETSHTSTGSLRRTASGNPVSARARRTLMSVATKAVLQAAKAEEEAEEAIRVAKNDQEVSEAFGMLHEAEAMAADAEDLMRQAENMQYRQQKRRSPPGLDPSPPGSTDPSRHSVRGRGSKSRSDADQTPKPEQKLHRLTGTTPRRTTSALLQPLSVSQANIHRPKTVEPATKPRAARKIRCSSGPDMDSNTINESKSVSFGASTMNIYVDSDSASNTAAPALAKTEESRVRRTASQPPKHVLAGQTIAPTVQGGQVGPAIVDLVRVLEESMKPALALVNLVSTQPNGKIRQDQIQDVFRSVGITLEVDSVGQILAQLGITTPQAVDFKMLVGRMKDFVSTYKQPKVPAAAGSVAAPEDKSDAPTMWQCSLCTKTNVPEIDNCSVCGRASDHSVYRKPTRRVLRHEASVQLQALFRGSLARKAYGAAQASAAATTSVGMKPHPPSVPAPAPPAGPTGQPVEEVSPQTISSDDSCVNQQNVEDWNELHAAMQVNRAVASR